MNDNILTQQKGNKKSLWSVVILVVTVAICLIIYVVSNKSSTDKKTADKISKIAIPQKVLDNKFGWLGGGADDTGDGIVDRSGLWVRPHPGAFVWDIMQKTEKSEIDFSLADKEVGNFQKNGLGILATVWPFADWDQSNLVNATNCAVPDEDEFLPKNDKKGRGYYLPKYRCNPSNWSLYKKYIATIVERYDGDGVNDMPNLVMPIKYWEVMNEPDLQYLNNMSGPDANRLNFYMQGPNEYATLLINTSEAIRSSDQEAKILIAGASGADTRMLSFYQEVFTDPKVAPSFDIGNIHCISNDQKTADFNVGPYKKMMENAGISGKTIWVTEAEAMYSAVAEDNFLSTKKSVEGAILAGAEKIFFTREDFGDTRTDMSKITPSSNYPSAEKYRDIIKSYFK